MKKYNWPGNVRELKNLVHKIYLLKRNGDSIVDIFQEIENRSVGYDEIMKNFGCLETENRSLTEILECLEKKIIENALNKTEGNISKTAVLLKLKPSTLRDKIKKYQLLKHTENYGNS